MFGMWNVRDVGCSSCGMWDVECLPGCGMLIYKMPIFKWPRMIRFKFHLRTSLILLTEILFTDLEGSLDLHSLYFIPQFKISSFQQESLKYFKIFFAKIELPLLLRCNFLFPRCSSTILLLSTKSIVSCSQ